MFRETTLVRWLAAIGLCLAVCAGSAGAELMLRSSDIDWTTSGEIVQFHLRFTNPGSTPSEPVTGEINSQEFGVFQPDWGLIGAFDVPALQPDSFFDIFIDAGLSDLPPNPDEEGGPHPEDDPCPPDDHWDGNIDIVWNGPGGDGQVNKHIGEIRVCPGSGASLIHIAELICPVDMPWTISGLCPGYSAALMEEDMINPAPNPVPPGWSGWISITADASVAVPDTCCFEVTFECEGVPGVIDLCAITCDCGQDPFNPVLTTVDWVTLPGTETVRFHQLWRNPSATEWSSPVSGDMHSQEFGAFQPNWGPIGPFEVPSMPPDSFFDIFLDVGLSNLPPNPDEEGGPHPENDPCPQDDHWDGNVDIHWNGPGGQGQTNYHIGELFVCPGAGASLIHIVELFCPSDIPWSISGLCEGYSVTLLEEDMITLAPNPVPPGWLGWISITADASVSVPDTCCFQVIFECEGEPGIIDLCAITCDCGQILSNPVLTAVDWVTLPGAPIVQFHQLWRNPSPTEWTPPISGNMRSQEFGVFMPEFAPIGQFEVPSMPPDSFFDVFFDVPVEDLPPNPDEHGGPDPDAPCPPDEHWDGNVDIDWTGPAGSDGVNYHFGELHVCTGSGASLIHIAALLCNAEMPWSVTGLCPGYNATLFEEDMITPAPNPVPTGWTGWISVTADASVSAPDTCCFQVIFECDGVPGVIDMCAITCDCGVADVDFDASTLEFGIRRVIPNPTAGPATVQFMLPSDQHVTVEIIDVAGHRIRTIADGRFAAGIHTATWDSRGAKGDLAGSGVYFIRMIGEQKTKSRKFVLRR